MEEIQENLVKKINELINQYDNLKKFIELSDKCIVKDTENVTVKEFLLILKNVFSKVSEKDELKFDLFVGFGFTKDDVVVKNEIIKFFMFNFEEIKQVTSESECIEILKIHEVAYFYYTEWKALHEKYNLNSFDFNAYGDILYYTIIDFISKNMNRYKNGSKFISSLTISQYIEIMCDYYREDYFSEKNSEDKEKLIQSLFIIVSRSGTSMYKDYLPNGIENIKNHFKKLSKDIIENILFKFSAVDIINLEITRLQIFTVIDECHVDENIIKCSTEQYKKLLKFRFLDSVRIINKLHASIHNFEHKIDSNTNKYTYNLDGNYPKELFIETINMFKDNNLPWKVVDIFSFAKIELYNNNPIITVTLDTATNKINLINHINNEVLSYNFDYEDWQLNKYMTRDFLKETEKFITQKDYIFKTMTFSLLYLDGSNGINESVTNFLNVHNFDTEKKIITHKEKTSNYKNIYGENVNSLTCIVGKNGTGKTSSISFMKDTFFKLFKLINEGKIRIVNGKISDVSIDYTDLVGKYKFCVVFRLNNINYYISNIDVNIGCDDVIPYKTLRDLHYYEYSKIIYFSSMIGLNDSALYDVVKEERKRSVVPKNNDTNRGKAAPIMIVNDFKVSDYSDMASFMKLQRAILENVDKTIKLKNTFSEYFNEDLFYKILFIKDKIAKEDEKTVNAYIEKDLKDLSIVREIDKPDENIVELGFETEDQLTTVRRILDSLDARIQHLSAGQFAKLTFLSKLYWVLEGYTNNDEIVSKYFKNNFDVEHVLQENQSAIIFIDEGELYYHPEWQRTYISTLLDFIKNCGKNLNIQIVVSTNSPFMVSDVLSEDVTYLPAKTDDINTFGQNIHKLLTENFFMDNTIGEFSRNFIDELVTAITNIDKKANCDENVNKDERVNRVEEENLYKNFLKKYYDKSEIDRAEGGQLYKYFIELINLVGEGVYRNMLTQMLDKTSIGLSKSEQDIINSIDQQIKALEKKKAEVLGRLR